MIQNCRCGGKIKTIGENRHRLPYVKQMRNAGYSLAEAMQHVTRLNMGKGCLFECTECHKRYFQSTRRTNAELAEFGKLLER